MAPKFFIWEIIVILNPARFFPREQPHTPGLGVHFGNAPGSLLGFFKILQAGWLGEPAALWLWLRDSGWSMALLCRACDFPSDRPIVVEPLLDPALAHGNSGPSPAVNAGQNGAPVWFAAENPHLSEIEMASDSRLHPCLCWITAGLRGLVWRSRRRCRVLWNIICPIMVLALLLTL